MFDRTAQPLKSALYLLLLSVPMSWIWSDTLTFDSMQSRVQSYVTVLLETYLKLQQLLVILRPIVLCPQRLAALGFTPACVDSVTQKLEPNKDRKEWKWQLQRSVCFEDDINAALESGMRNIVMNHCKRRSDGRASGYDW